MNRCTFVLIGVILFISQTQAQNIQSNDWSQSKTLIEQNISNQNYNTAIELLEKSIEQSLEDDQLSEAYLLYTKIALKTGRYEVADFYLNKLKPLASSTNNQELKVRALLTQLSYDFRTEETNTLLMKLKSLRAQNDFKNDPSFQPGITEIIILCNLKLGEYDSSLVYLNENIKQYKTLKNLENYSNALQNKAFCLVELNQSDSVLTMLNKSIQIARSEGLLELQLEGLFMMGKYYLQFGPKEAALMHLDAARVLTQQGEKSSLESRAFLAQYYYIRWQKTVFIRMK
jgi:tetratricopeptide (TPR) repeat protein